MAPAQGACRRLSTKLIRAVRASLFFITGHLMGLQLGLRPNQGTSAKTEYRSLGRTR